MSDTRELSLKKKWLTSLDPNDEARYLLEVLKTDEFTQEQFSRANFLINEQINYGLATRLYEKIDDFYQKTNFNHVEIKNFGLAYQLYKEFTSKGCRVYDIPPGMGRQDIWNEQAMDIQFKLAVRADYSRKVFQEYKSRYNDHDVKNLDYLMQDIPNRIFIAQSNTGLLNSLPFNVELQTIRYIRQPTRTQEQLEQSQRSIIDIVGNDVLVQVNESWLRIFLIDESEFNRNEEILESIDAGINGGYVEFSHDPNRLSDSQSEIMNRSNPPDDIIYPEDFEDIFFGY